MYRSYKVALLFFAAIVFFLAGCQQDVPLGNVTNGSLPKPDFNASENLGNYSQDSFNASFYCTNNNNGYVETSVSSCKGAGCIPSGCFVGKPLTGGSIFDLDVAYIERTPRYYRYDVIYEDDLPRLKPGTEEQKRWPDVGEKVNYTAHVVNKGGLAAPFSYVFFEDSAPVSSGYFNYSLGSNEAAVVKYSSFFRPDMNVTFKIFPESNDLFSVNNQLSIGSDDLALSIWVEKGQYEQLNSRENIAGTSSFEDWVQGHFSVLNQRFSQAEYDVSQAGIIDRVRIDKIVITENLDGGFSDPDEFLIDGRWSFSDNDATNAAGISGAWKRYAEEYVGKTDFGLIHELAHQLGVIDLYRLNLPNDPDNNNRIEIKDINSVLLTPSKLPTFAWGQTVFSNAGLMGGGSISPYTDGTFFDSHTAAGLNSNHGKRRGFYGEYLYDTPKSTRLRILDKNGVPIKDAELSLYQKDAKTEVIDAVPEIRGSTDIEGFIDLPNRETQSVTTETGHMLQPNPFGKISVVGTNGNMIVQVIKDGEEGYGFFLLTDLNMNYWNGSKDGATIDISTNYPLN